MPAPSPRLLIDYVRSLHSVRLGLTPRDKFALLMNRILQAGFPLSFLWYESFGRPLLDPTSLISGYRCRYGEFIFYCPGGNSEIQFLPDWEPEVKQMMAKPRDGDAVDVGANLGLYSVMLGHHTDGKVLSVEPEPRYFKWLRKNVEANHCENVIPVNIAAWSSSTKLKLNRHVFGGPPVDSSTSSDARLGYTVDAQPLDKVLSRLFLRPKIVKIDVEGSEYQVLTGMIRTLRTCKPVLILEAPSQESLSRCRGLLNSLSYDIQSLKSGNFVASVS